MPPMLDAETKAIINEVRAYLAEGNKIKAAVSQLEEQMKGLPRDIESKLAAVRSMAFDPRGNYRGVAFGSEAEARSFGLFVLASVAGDQRSADALKTEFKDLYQRAMGGSPTSAGGAMVPVEFSNRIQRLVEEFGVWAANAFPMPMTSDSLSFTRRISGLRVFKVGQNEAATESTPKFGTVRPRSSPSPVSICNSSQRISVRENAGSSMRARNFQAGVRPKSPWRWASSSHVFPISMSRSFRNDSAACWSLAPRQQRRCPSWLRPMPR